MASITNLFVDQGSDYSNIITVESATGVGLDLTNFTVKSQMRKSYTSSIAYDFTAVVSSAVDGQITLSLSSADSEEIPPGRYLYDVEITSPTPLFKKTRVVEGIATITPQITQV